MPSSLTSPADETDLPTRSLSSIPLSTNPSFHPVTMTQERPTNPLALPSDTGRDGILETMA